MTVRQIEALLDDRIETGALQIGDDWPGLFVRGDDCLNLKFWLGIVRPDVDKYSQGIIDELLESIQAAIGDVT